MGGRRAAERAEQWGCPQVVQRAALMAMKRVWGWAVRSAIWTVVRKVE